MRFEGKTVEDAKARACIQLEKTIKELNVEIIDNGSKGFLGIGSKPAVIEVTVKGEEEKRIIPPTTAVPKKLVEENTAGNDGEKTSEEISEEIEKSEINLVSVSENIEFNIENEVKEYLTKLINLMGIKDVEIQMEVDNAQKAVNTIIKTDESTKIIGKRGLILDAIQTLVNTTFGKQRASYWIKLDCDNYREKRLKTIESLAYRSASTVKKYKKRVVLDNLNANERRIVHSVLQHDKRIETHSEGREPDRKLIITLKRNYYR